MNKKVVGKFKNECSSFSIHNFVGLRPNMNSILMAEIRKAKKGIKTVVKKDLKHEHYIKILQERKQMTYIQVVIKSHKHQIGVYDQNKVNFNPLDKKNG